MDSLESYKEQVYNLGSPSPNPQKPPLANLSVNVDNDFEFSSPKDFRNRTNNRKKVAPSKIPKVTPSRKRSSCSEEPHLSSPKKIKMMSQDELRELFTKMNTQMDKLYSKLDTISSEKSKLIKT